MPQDTAALARLDVPPMEPERLARELGELNAEVRALDRRLTASDESWEKRYQSFIRDRAADSQEVGRVSDILTGQNGTNGYCSRVRHLEMEARELRATIDGLVSERRQALAVAAAHAPRWWHRVGTALAISGALGLIGVMVWLVVAAGPRILAIWSAGGAP